MKIVKENYSYEWTGNNLIIWFNETLSYEDVRNIDDMIYGDKRFDSMKYQLWDLSKVQIVHMSDKQAGAESTLDHNAARWNKSVKVGFAAVNKRMKEIIDQYASAYEGFKWQVKTFDNFEDTLAWCEG